jgi:hypothetical protein
MERNEAFEALRTLILECPMTHEYKIKLLDAFSAYIKTLP